MDRETELILWRRHAAGDKTATDQIVLALRPNIEHLAFRICGGRRHAGTSLRQADLVQEGFVALMKQLDRFDPGKGTRLATFITGRVRGAMLDAIRNDDFVCRSARARGVKTKLESAPWERDDQNDREPSQSVPVATQSDREDHWRYMTRGLSRNQRILVLLYFREGLTLRQIGEQHIGLTESRCSQLLSQTIRFIRAREATR